MRQQACCRNGWPAAREGGARSVALAQRMGLTAARHDELLGRITCHLPVHRTAADAVLTERAP
jgi:hypothetical protein